MKQFTNQEISAFCEELGWLLHSGVSVGEGLRLMEEDETETVRKGLLSVMAEKTEEGDSFAEVLKETECFPGYACGSIAAGEKTGRLEEALGALKQYYEERERISRYMRNALLHPSFLLLLMLAVLGVLLTMVLPTFRSVYASLGGEMTGIAGVILRVGIWLKEKIWVFLFLFGAAICLVLLFSVWEAFREKIISFWKKWAGDSGVMRKVNAAAVAQVMAMGLGSGLVLEETMELAAEVMADVPKAKKRCLHCREQLLSGIPLVEALKQSEVLPAASCRLLGVGIQAGNGDAVMAEIAKKLSEEAETAMTNRVDKIEPVLVLSVSVLVGMVLLLVMLPLINIMETIG